MSYPFELEIATRDRLILRAKVCKVIIPTNFGSLGLSDASEKMNVPVERGVVKCSFDSGNGILVRVERGFAEAANRKVVLTVADAEIMEEQGESE